MTVWDSSALIAYVRKESGWEVAANYLDSAVMSCINLTESLSRLHFRSAIPLEPMQAILSKTIPQFIPLSYAQAVEAASIHIQSRAFGLSYGDCACLALAKARNEAVLTADREWAKQTLGVEIIAIR